MARTRLAVVGGGLIGVGVAQRFALAGHPVAVHNRSPESSRRAADAFARRMAHLVDLRLTTAGNAEAARSAVTWHVTLEGAVASADVVVETVAEDLALKRELFARLDTLCPPEVILASSTSGLPIAQIAGGVARGDRVIGTHFLNPPTLLPGVEVVPWRETAAAITQRTVALLRDAGMRPSVVADIPGFIASRLSVALRREAWAIVADGLADPETVDSVWRDGLGRAYAASGPLEISDTSGLDVLYAVHAELEPHLHGGGSPPARVAEMVAGGRHGVKTGRGFYTWTDARRSALERRRDAVLAAIAAVLD